MDFIDKQMKILIDMYWINIYVSGGLWWEMMKA
jgi:hypothetical protein